MEITHEEEVILSSQELAEAYSKAKPDRDDIKEGY